MPICGLVAKIFRPKRSTRAADSVEAVGTDVFRETVCMGAVCRGALTPLPKGSDGTRAFLASSPKHPQAAIANNPGKSRIMRTIAKPRFVAFHSPGQRAGKNTLSADCCLEEAGANYLNSGRAIGCFRGRPHTDQGKIASCQPRV